MASPGQKSSRSPSRPAARAKAPLATVSIVGPGGVSLKGGKRPKRGFGKDSMLRADRADASSLLLRRYGEAFAQSGETGKAVSFKVEVSPDGSARATPVEAVGADHGIVQVETQHERNPELEQALAAARQRGQIAAAEILKGSDMLSADDFAKRLGTSRMTVNTKRQNGQVLGLDGAKRGFRFPVWQLDAEGKPYPEIAVLHDRLGAPWAVYRLLIQRQAALGGLTGRQALERQMGRNLVALAESVARGDFA